MTLGVNVGVAGGDDKHQPIRLIHTQVLHQAPLVFEMKRRQLCWQGGGGYAGEERLAQGWGDTGKALRAQEWLCEQVLRIGDR